MIPHRHPLRYYGSKRRIAQQIIDHFPHHDHYCEPFGGSMAVLLCKPPSKLETYNDLDRAVYTFFKVIRERPDDLIRAIEFSPYSRLELDVANDTFVGGHYGRLGEVEIARRFYVRCQQGRSSGSSVWRTTWRYLLTDNRHRTHISEWNETRHLWATADRIKQVQLECRPALEIIQKYDTPDTLFYLDPPYTHNERAQNWLKAYQFEMSLKDHINLFKGLNGIQGMAIISGYQSRLYTELYEVHGWQRYDIQARTNTNQYKTESIWLNPAAQCRARQLRLAV